MRARLLISLALLALGLAAQWFAPDTRAQTPAPGTPRVVYVASVEGMVDPGLAPYIARALDTATRANAAALLLDINTFGGRVDAAVQIRDALLNSRVRTIAFVNKRAISAGALIALAAHQVAMGSGGTIGAATPVQLAGAGGGVLPVEEKTVSYVRKEFRATAEARGRPPLVAEAMVDPDVAIPGVIEKGKLLTLTTDEALRLKVAELRADTLEQVLQQAGLAGAEVRRVLPNWAENLVRLLTQPLVASLLVTVAMLGIVLELKSPGFGIPGALGLGSLALVLWGHWLAQLAGMEELALAVIGLVLIALEIFVIPGFGIAGALGIAALLAGLVLSFTGAGSTASLLLAVAGRIVFALLAAIALAVLLVRYMGQLPGGRRLVLRTELSREQGWASPPPEDAQWLGRRGRTTSMLRPAGIADIDGHRLDVVSEGELIEAGEPVEVVRVDGNRIVVRRLPTYRPPAAPQAG